MIVRRPGTWGTMSGEGTDDDSSSRGDSSSKGIGMSGLQQQQQQVKAVESSRPGSSGSISSSGGWGTCSELLLVSAVKKHGVPNWNLVAAELRARALVLNISPSCFTEEACRFQYNALKGKFSSSAGSVSSPDDDLDGVSWIEELRKLRMSRLKEELQVYDSSIGQLQSRISKLQEERALSPPSVMKQHDSRRESRLSILSINCGRANRVKRLKAKGEAKLKRMSRPAEIREVGGIQTSERITVAEVEVPEVVEEKDINDTSGTFGQTQQSKNARISSCGPSRLDEVGSGSIQLNVVVSPDSPTVAIGDGTHNGLECSAFDEEKSNAVDADIRPTDMEVLQAGSDLPSNQGVKPRSPEDGMPLLTVALGLDPHHAEPDPRSRVVIPPTLESTLNTDNELEVSLEGNSKHEEAAVQAEIPHEVKSAVSSMIVSEMDEKTEDVVAPKEANDVMVESETLAVGSQDEEAEVYEIDTIVADGEEGETLETTDPAMSRSVGEDLHDTLETKGSENGQEESRDGPETGEVQQSFPDYIDSQIDKSEVGSSMDSIEDMTPSSRKNWREPKVPGKFLPLLECLRVICAHKFAPLFRQRQEYQDRSDYGRLVRRHVDLNMVRARLEDGAYSGSVEFFRDLLLIFTNALVYNSSDSQEYVGAKALRSCALIEMDKILQTEALLKQNGPATRKREVRKSMEVHKARVSSSSTGSEVRKKGILKGTSSETPAALLDSHGGAKGAHIAFEDPYAGRSSNNNDVDRDLDVKIETTFKKAASYRIVKEETPRKESQKPEFLSESGFRSAGGGYSGKKVKVDRDALKTGLQGQLLADLRASGGRLNVENIGTKTAPAKMKDVICIDLGKKGTPINSSSLVSLGKPEEKQRTTPISRQTSTSHVSRSSKRGGDSTPSNPKKRVRK